MKRPNEQLKRGTIKLISTLCAITASALAAGCATGGGLVLDTVGPVQAPVTREDSATGTLVVYSAYEVNADFNSRNPNVPEYSDYRILDADGKLIQRVHNVTDDSIQGLVPVELPAGKYNVIAHSNGYGYVTVPVIIETRQNTILHLEGGGSCETEVVPLFEF
jgi:hypothetical protein